MAGSESANADATVAMFEDLSTLLSAIAPVAAGYSVAIVCSPTQAVKLKLRLLTARDPGFTVLASSAVPDATIIAVAANTLVSASSPNPTFDVSTQAVVTMEDTTPLAIVGGGSTPAANTRSIYQTDSIGLKIRFGAAWGLRSATGLAWLENVLW